MSSAQGRLRGHRTKRQAQLVQGLRVGAASLVVAATWSQPSGEALSSNKVQSSPFLLAAPLGGSPTLFLPRPRLSPSEGPLTCHRVLGLGSAAQLEA